MTIRPAREDDLEALIRMTLEFLESGPYRFLKSTPAKIAALVNTVRQHGEIFVGEVDGQVVGMIAAFQARHPLTFDFYAEEMVWWVDPAYRKGTLGPRLLRRVEEWATAEGMVMLKMVAPAGTDIGEFYERSGYFKVEATWGKVLNSDVGLQLAPAQLPTRPG